MLALKKGEKKKSYKDDLRNEYSRIYKADNMLRFWKMMTKVLL